MSVYSRLILSPIRQLPGLAISVSIPDSGIAGGNARGAASVDLQAIRAAATQVASGANSGILSGGNNSATNSYTVVGGGLSNIAQGNRSAVLGGEGNAANNTYSVTLGGYQNIAAGVGTWILGGLQANTRGHYGRGAWASGQIAVAGDAQAGEYVLRRQTTDATATRLTSDAAAASLANTINLPDFGADYGVLIGSPKACWPIDPAGTIFAAAHHKDDPTLPRAGLGIDLLSAKISGSAFRSQGFSVDGNGNIKGSSLDIGPAQIARASGDVTLAVTRQVATAVTVAAGGVSHYVGETLTDAYGGVYEVATISGTAVATVTMLIAPTASNPPTNPVALASTDSGAVSALPSGCTVNLTWSSADAALRLSGNGTKGVQLGAHVKAAGPTTSDIPNGHMVIWRDTAAGTTKIVYNNGGTLQSATLA